MSVSFPATTNARVTAGLRCPPEIVPVAPVRNEIARPCAMAIAINLALVISIDNMPANSTNSHFHGYCYQSCTSHLNTRLCSFCALVDCNGFVCALKLCVLMDGSVMDLYVA